MKQFQRSVIWVALCVVVVSLSYSAYYHDRPRVDAAAYDKIGWNLTRGFGYVEDETNTLSPEKDWGINRLGPGYEFFLALVYSIFGHHYWVVYIFHAFLRGASVFILYRIAELLFPSMPSVWFLAVILFGFSPDLVVVNGMLLTETLFLFLFLCGFYFTLLVFSNGGLKNAGVAGLFFALAILTRPTALLILVAAAFIFLWKQKIRLAIALIITPLILVGSWSLFASLRYDRFILTTGVGAYDIWVGNHFGASGGFEKAPDIQIVRNSINSKELDAISRRKYIEFLTRHPFAFLELQIRKTALYFSLARPGGFWIGLWDYPVQLFITLALSFVWTSILFIVGIAGAFMLLKERSDLKMRFMLTSALLQPISVIPIIVETRYRYSLFPFLALFCAYFLIKRPVVFKYIFIVGAAILMATAYDVIFNYADIVGKIGVFLFP